MRKIEPIKDDPIGFMGDIISMSKKREIDKDDTKRVTDDFRNRCLAIVSENEQAIKQYDDAFETNSLEDLQDIGRLNEEEKDDFLSLYSYKKKKIAHLRNAVLTQNGYINDTCPLCECDSVSTMDHYLPKEKYSLYVVHPRNLIPCCSSCNQNKSNNVFREGKRMFWNCYLDNPINTRYLYCTIKINNEIVTGEFSINCGELTERDSFIIENTMNETGQNVLNQYNKKIGNEITELIKRISSLMMKGDGFDGCIRKIKEVVLSNCVLNDWKDVLNEALLNSADFLEFAEKEVEKIIKCK